MAKSSGRRRSSTAVSVELPAEILPRLGATPAEVAACLKQLALIDLFRRGEISSGKAAEVLGMSRWDFIRLLAEHKIPYFDLSEEELQHDAEVASRHRRHRDESSPTPDH